MVHYRRNLQQDQRDGVGSFAQRFVVKVRERHPIKLLVLAFVHLTFELCDLVIYAWSQYNAVCTGGKCWQSSKVIAPASTQQVLFYVQAVLHVWFLCGWVVAAWAATEKLSFVLSRWSLVTMTVSVAVVIFAIAAMSGAEWSFYIETQADGTRKGNFPWLPTFLRIWTFYDTAVFLVNAVPTNMSLPKRQIIEMVLSLMSTMITCLCFFQASQSYFSENVPLFESTYFAVVTFGTIGFGDIEPDHWASRQVTVFILVVAVYTFPPFFSNVAALARQMSLNNSYSSRGGRRRHVIFAGKLGSREINYFINEFCGGMRRFDALQIVVMSSEGFSQDMRMRVLAPEFNKRICLMQGDPRKRDDLDRADAAYADSIFIANSDDLPAMDVDADVILKTTSVLQYDRHLPQHAVIRRERNTSLLRMNNVRNVLEKERLKFSLLGMGVISNGAIPLIINLVRSYDSEVEAHTAKTWQEQTEWSMGNELYAFSVPPALVGKTFLQCAFLYREAVVSVIGVVGDDGKVVLNPKGVIVTAETQLLCMAADEGVIHARTKELQESPADVYQALGRRLDSAIACNPGHSSGSPGRGSRGTAVNPNPAARAGGKHRRRDGRRSEAVVRVTPDNDQVLGGLSGHVVLIDLHSAHIEHAKSEQAEADGEIFRAKDLFNLMRSIKLQDASVQILLLSRGVVHPSFDEQWRATEYEPIYHLEGCGLHHEDLKAARIFEARGALIFSTAESTDLDADTMTMLVNASIHDVCRTLAKPNHEINVVSDIKHMDSLTLVPPYYTSDKMTELAASNFAFEPAFVVGRLICGSMLDSALYQTYFNPEILRTVDAFIYGNGRTASLSSMRVPVECTTYRDVELQCARLGFLPIALYRVIEDGENAELNGHRFLFVNPHSDCQIRESDSVYFLV